MKKKKIVKIERFQNLFQYFFNSLKMRHFLNIIVLGSCLAK